VHNYNNLHFLQDYPRHSKTAKLLANVMYNDDQEILSLTYACVCSSNFTEIIVVRPLVMWKSHYD
jgi:hypothetical protein